MFRFRGYYKPRVVSRYTNPVHPRRLNARRDVHYVRFGSGGYRGSDIGIKVGAGILVLGTGYYVSHLEQVPETGRWRFMNTSPQFEEKIGRIAREQSREEYQNQILPPNHPVSRHVRRVVSRILDASNLGVLAGGGDSSLRHVLSLGDAAGEIGSSSVSGETWGHDSELDTKASTKEWDVMVVNDPKIINAQAVPGLIIVYTGILPVCQDEQGLAAVLAHEIGHVVARHTAERLSSQTVIIALAALFQLSLGLDVGLSGILQKLLFELPNSRTQELEADKIGLTLMSRACFDPKASPEMFRRLAQIESKISPRLNLDFLQTHPSSVSRVEHLENLLPEGYAILAANPDCASIQDRLRAFREETREGRGFFGL